MCRRQEGARCIYRLANDACENTGTRRPVAGNDDAAGVASRHTVNLRPLKDRVLIRPEVPSDTTPSGLILAEHRKPEQTGTVVAVGSIEHPRRDEVLEIATALDEIFDQ